MYAALQSALRRPRLYQPCEHPFWDDPHISAQMLAAHLDPTFEGASRSHAFIHTSAQWLHTLAPPATHPALLDVGCGPGLYTEAFHHLGYRVTGIDLSRRSIAHARQSAKAQELDISYVCKNYLQMNFIESFDFATFIYCDYGALSPQDRKSILQSIYAALRPGGKLLLDVFSMAFFHTYEEKQSWASFPHGGFWNAQPYLALERTAKYQKHVTLAQTLVVTETEVLHYPLWTCCFTPARLKRECESAGFQLCALFGDVAGAPYSSESPTLAILLQK